MSDERENRTTWEEFLNKTGAPPLSTSWKAMEGLLDRDMPAAPRRRGWPWLLLLLLLLLIGVCNYYRGAVPFRETSQKRRGAGAPVAGTSRSAAPGARTPVTGTPHNAAPVAGTPVGGASVAEAPAAGMPRAAAPATGAPVAGTPAGAQAAGAPIAGASLSAAPRKKTRDGVTGSTVEASAGQGSTRRPTAAPTTQGGAATTMGAIGSTTSRATRAGGKNGTSGAAGTDMASPVNTGTATARPATAGVTAANTAGTNTAAAGTTNANTPGAGTAGANTPGANTPSASTGGAGTGGAKTTSTAGASTTSASTTAGGKTTVKPSDTTTLRKPAPASAGKKAGNNTGKSAGKKDPWPPYKGFTAGIGLNQFFPVGQQVNANFNSSGNNGTITDYLPVPEVRYYFNKRLYVQAEAQFNTPQYTSKNLLAAQQSTVNSAGGFPVTTTNSVYIKKLFYFNLPISIHYSPVRNLSLGAGLEFARLTNGVADYQRDVSYGVVVVNDSVTYSKVQTFKGDSIYQKLRTYEWRLLGDVNYQWHGFTLGARYNWATDKFIHVQVSSTQVTQSRNTSVQLYLRYTIWKQPYPKKKKK